jgi:ketosteroid isomerase-like protein
MTNSDLIHQAYQAFNARDIDGVLALMHPDVYWPNGWEGGYVAGHDEVRNYWLRQWQEIDPIVTPVSIGDVPSGQIEVTVHQVVKDWQGTLLADGLIKHLYTIHDGKISRMDIKN